MRREGRSRSSRVFADRLPSERQRALELNTKLIRIRGENRGGRHFRRRYKSACLTLLEHLQFIIQSVIAFTHPNVSRAVLRRAGQIDTRITQCRADQLPGRREPLLTRIVEEEGESEADSEAVESIRISSSESEAEPVVTDNRPTGVWATGRYTNVQITSSNPLLRSSSSSSRTGGEPVPRPSSSSSSRTGGEIVLRPSSSSSRRTLGEPVTIPQGTEIVPPVTHRTAHTFVLSLDWHQVLDAVRLSNQETLRPKGYYILGCVKERLRELKQQVPSLVICVNSYCHCEEFRRGVPSIPDSDCIDYRIVTDRKTGAGGKLDALRAILPPRAGCCHIDDNAEVLEEFADHQRRSNLLNLKPLGIAIPRAGRRRPQERTDKCDYYKSVVHALDHLIQGL